VTRVGIVGCGNIARVYAEKLGAAKGLALGACADLLPERARAFAETHALARALEPAALVADPEIDLVVNLTVPLAHARVSRAALDAGKAVYSEKPLAVELPEGRALVEAARRRGVRLGCAPDTFLGAGLQTCRRLIDAGAIGEPVGASGFFLSPGPESWHPGPQIFYQRGAGPLFDLGPYYLTALVFLLGPARHITGMGRITRAERTIGSEPLRGQRFPVEVPTHVASLIEFESGPIATLVTSFDVRASRYRNLEVYGSEATLSVPDPNTFGGPVMIRRSLREDWEEVPLSHPNAEQSRGLGVMDLVAAARSGRAHRASGELALHVLELMEGAIRSSERGTRLELETRCPRPAPLPLGLAPFAFEED
jgi:predicted dehydrogenase